MKKKLFLLWITVFTMFSMFSQGKYGHVTPQTAEFMMSGKFPVSMYTGKLTISIPIYNIKDPDFNLPVSVSYNADGFKPNKNPGVIGYNWTLNAGGCITREVANIPDEHENVDNNIELGAHGFLTLSRLRTYSPDHIYNYSPLVGQFAQLGSGSYFKLYDNTNTLMESYEYMPDVFSFNFCGKSGQFLIGNDGGVKLISEEWIDVDLDGVQSFQPQRSVFRCIPENIVSDIIITDTIGYKYFFGGSNTAVEYTISVDCNTNGELRDNAMYQQTTPTINAWHLTKIVAPNGREMIFHYIKPIGAGCYLKSDPLWQYSKNRTVEGVTTMSATKSAILEKISIPDINFELNFTHTTQGTRKIFDNASDFNNLNYKLTSIIGTIDNEQLCNIGFEHEHYGDNSVRGYLFLKAINISNDLNPHKYQFTYDVENKTFPDPYLIGRQYVDDFGYWNSNNFLGLIKTITYPTGGVGEFTFEHHDYGTKRYFEYKNINGSAYFDPMFVGTAPMQIGG
ncbi:MAG: hypothetical protein Q8T08_23825, partial [Ignavibacteria bacterium]|nr:hypothetical protein [Ignavibacteria bacterium]